jgi:dienelactone hydrolase
MTTRVKLIFLCTVFLLLVWSYFARPIYDYAWIVYGREHDTVVDKIEPPATSQLYDDVVAMNTRTVAEVDAYLNARREQSVQSPPAEVTGLDFSSPEAYQASTGLLRAGLEKTLGFPLSDAIHGSDFSTVQQTPIGEDDLATYTLLSIPALPGVNMIGTLIEPKKHDPKMPLIIANHGRGAMPDRPPDGKISVMSNSNRDLARGAVERGWAVFEPIFLFYGKDYPDDIRDTLTLHAQEIGITLPAIEITKLIRSIDYLTSRPEIDPQRVAMVGMSYGGFYTLYTTALEPRIQVAVVAAYFNDRAHVLDLADPKYGFIDWRYPNSLSLFTDPHIVALVCPRPLLIESGTQDQLFQIEGARQTIPLARDYYAKLHLDSNFAFDEFVGRHDFDGGSAWQFIDKVWQAKK